ncbi:MAG: thioredoxin-like domain-containing protein [Flavobacteriaceae bacterium]
MKKLLLLLFLLIVTTAQSQIRGHLKHHAGQKLTLTGFNNLKSEMLSITTIDSLGNFILIYPNNYKGMAVLEAKDKSSLVFVLTEPNLKIIGTHLSEKDSLTFINSKENNVLVKYFKDYSQRQRALSAWNYLKQEYQKDGVFYNQKATLKNINTELNRIKIEDSNYLKALDKGSYMSWFLPLKKVVSDMPVIVRHNTEKIPESIKQFRGIDFNNPKFKTSGLLKDLIEGHYMLLENSGQSSDSIFTQINISTDYLINNLEKNEVLLNEVGDYLFNYLEKRSLYTSSEYLAVQLLSQNSCSLDDKLTNKLEAYRKLKIGNIAPDITFSDGKKLSSITATKLLIFGASWCPKCKEETLKLNTYYHAWKEKGIEVVYISIDTEKAHFDNAYKNTPWKTDCTFKGWNTQAVKDYHVFATPTYFVLDSDLKIVLRPNSIEQVHSWVNSKFKAN